MFDHTLESSHRDDSYEWFNVGFGEDITQVGSIEVNLTNLIWSSGHMHTAWTRMKSQVTQCLIQIHCSFHISLSKAFWQ